MERETRRHRGLSGASLRAAVALALALSAATASAQGPPAKCRFEQAPAPLVFNGYTGLAPVWQGASVTFSYWCPPASRSAWIGISAPRVMTGPGALAFELYTTAALADPWTASPPIPVSPDTGFATVHGLLPAQDASVGFHQTTLQVRLYSGSITNETDMVELVVQADVTRSCIIDPATLAFGNYDPVGANATAPRDAQSAIQIACTGGTPYAVGLGPGSNAAGAVRQMANGAERLRYELYTDPGRTSVWSTTAQVGGTAPSNAPIPLPVYGRIFPGQFVGAGPYNDVVVSTINY
jgi:spore coat protein U-like protein